MTRRALILPAIFAAFALLAAVGVYAVVDAIAAGPGRRPAELWEIPGGYKGLIVAHFGVPGCPPLTRRDGHLVYEVRNGTYCSSDLLPEGSAVDMFVYVYEDGRRVTLRYGEEVGKLVVRGRVEPDMASDLFLFVGTPDEQRRAHDNLPRG